MKMEKGVLVRLFAEKGKTGTFRFRCEIEPPPPDVQDPELRITLQVPALLEYDRETGEYIGPFSDTPLPFDQLPRALKDYSLRARRADGTEITRPYHEKKGLSSDREIVITHPGWPELKAVNESDIGGLTVAFYGGRAPFGGYSLHFQTRKDETPLEAGGPVHDHGKMNLRPLLETFWEQVGQEIQVAVLNAEKLKASKQNPADFQDLAVRIAGCNARFMELSELEQDEIIRHAEAC